MTVQKDVTKNIYVGNGSTRTFPFTFECPAEHPEYIKVYLMQDDGTALATSDYQLDMDARQITYPSSGTALPEGKKLVIMRELPLQQMMNLVNNGPYFAEDVELAFDENVMAMQQIAEKLNRSIIMSVDIDGDAFVNEVPFEAGKSFRIADDGKSIVLTEDPARVLPLAQEAYTQAQAQAQSAAASAAAAAQSEDSAAASASEAGNSAQSASTSAASAAESAELTSGYKQEALTAKNAAATSATNAKASEANAKTSENNAEASKEAAQSAASNAATSAAAAVQKATAAATSAETATAKATAAADSASAANNYAASAKNYSENVNVFIPSVSSSGVLSWTNKAGLPNPASVNIKGAKGDKGDTGAQGAQGIQGPRGIQGEQGERGVQGAQGPAGNAATITIGNVTTSAPGTAASVTNRGTPSAAVLDFVLPKGKDGADGGVTVDDTLSDTSTNPVQNKVVKAALDNRAVLDESNTFTSPNLFGDIYMADGLSSLKWYNDSPNFVVATINSKKYTGEAATAKKATQDGDGNNIVATYAKKTDIPNITVDAELSDTSTNPIQNKAVKTAIDTVTASIPTKVSTLENDAGYLTQHQSLDGYAKTSVANTWTAQQNFHDLMLNREKYTTYVVNGTSDTPITSTMLYTAVGAFTLNLATLAGALSAGQSSVFTAYFAANADYSLTITDAGTLKYVGNASDVAITSAGLLLNIMMLKDASGNVTSIVQASKLS